MLKKIVFFMIIFFLPFSVLADTAHASVVMEMSSGRVLYDNNSKQNRLIASTTKIMTCIVVLENVSLDKKVTVGEEILKMYGTSIYLEVGEVLSVRDLVYGLMLRSGNDAAMALAIGVMGSEENFVLEMNRKAKEIGMNDTIFENVHGLDEKTKNYSTAYDMALLSKYAYHNKEYRKIIGTKKYQAKSSLKSYLWYNRMSLLNQYEYCMGGKNGYTPSAGKTLVSIAKKNDMVLTIVSLDDSDIYDNHKNLYEKYFSKYVMYQVLDRNNFQITSSFLDKNVYIKKSFYYPLAKNEIDQLNTLVSFHSLQKNNVIGDITIQLEKKNIGKINLYQKKKEEQKSSLIQKIKSLFLR